MRRYLALGTVMALGVSGQAFAADGFSYNNVEASYVKTEIDDVGVEGDGPGLSASMEFNEHVFGVASFNDLNYDAGVSTNAFSLGVGFNWSLGPELDLVSGVSYERLELGIAGLGDANEEGYGLNVGLRGRVAERLELTGTVKYTDLGDGVDDFTVSAGGRYYFSEAFAAGIDVSDNDDGTTWGIALRYDFGNRY